SVFAGSAMKEPKPLQPHREQIDKLDDEIVRLLNERARHVIEIGKLKKAADTQAVLHTPAREAEILERLCKHNLGPFPNEALQAVYPEIVSGSLSLEGPLKAASVAPARTSPHRPCGHQPSAPADTPPTP